MPLVLAHRRDALANVFIPPSRCVSALSATRPIFWCFFSQQDTPVTLNFRRRACIESESPTRKVSSLVEINEIHPLHPSVGIFSKMGRDIVFNQNVKKNTDRSVSNSGRVSRSVRFPTDNFRGRNTLPLSLFFSHSLVGAFVRAVLNTPSTARFMHYFLRERTVYERGPVCVAQRPVNFHLK